MQKPCSSSRLQVTLSVLRILNKLPCVTQVICLLLLHASAGDSLSTICCPPADCLTALDSRSQTGKAVLSEVLCNRALTLLRQTPPQAKAALLDASAAIKCHQANCKVCHHTGNRMSTLVNCGMGASLCLMLCDKLNLPDNQCEPDMQSCSGLVPQSMQP